VLQYSIGSVPWTIADGNAYSGNVYTGVGAIDTNFIDSHSLQRASFELEMSTKIISGQITAAVLMKYINPYKNYNSYVVLQTVVFEDSAGGYNIYSSVVRQMLPDAAGNYISKIWVLNDSLKSVNIWNSTLSSTAKLGVVAFLQEVNTNAILQSVYVKGQGNSGSTVITDVQNSIGINGEILVFPNPANNEVTILIVSDNERIENWSLIDNYGREIKSNKLNQGISININTSEIENGIYMVRIFTTNGKNYLQKLIVTHY
jgi:hypothetical protein